MKHNEKFVNRKALFKFLNIVLLLALIDGVLVLVPGFAGTPSLPDQIVAAFSSFLSAVTLWSWACCSW